MKTRTLVCQIGFLIAIVSLTAHAQTPALPDLKDGQAIEVREGDEWTAATFVRKEGRKFLIKYSGAGGGEEWVMADRIRMPGAAAKPGDAKPGDAKAGDPKAAPKPAAKARTTYAVNQDVEVKWNLSWRKAAVNRAGTGDWYLITYKPGTSQEWVEWWRIRKLGATDDVPRSPANAAFRPGDNPPRADAGDGPPEPKKEVAGTASEPKKEKDRDGDDAGSFAFPITERNDADIKEVLPAFSGAWAVAPDPADPKIVTGGQPVGFAVEKDMFVKRTIFHNGAFAGVQVRDERGGKTKSVRLQRFNLAGSTLPAVELDINTDPLGISLDGKRVVARSNAFGFGKKARLDVWNLAGGRAEHVISFSAFEKSGAHESDIKTAGFVNDTLVYAQAQTGELRVFEIASAKAVWSCKLDSKSPIVPSSSGKYLFGLNDNDLVCIEAATGTVMGIIQGGCPVTGNIAVSPDGNWLVGSAGGVVTIFDLKSGTNTGAVGLPVGSTAGAVVALPDGYALVGSALFDLNKRMPVWQYDGAEDPFVAGGRCWSVLTENKRTSLVTAKLPHDPARKAAEKLDPSNAFCLKPGDKVALDVAITASPEETKEVVDHLNAELQRAGFVVDPGAPIKIVVRTEDGKTVTQNWNHFAAGPFSSGGTEVPVTEKFSRVTIDVGGKPAWEAKILNRLGSVGRKMGQTIAQAVAEANTYDIRFLKTAVVPNYVLKPEATAGLGQSKWALGGVKDGK